jgi:serine/threonine protein phosphatase 1
MRRFVIGDIHGAHKALEQVIERSGIDRENDELILLGDIVDGYPEVAKTVEELLTFKYIRGVLGNHDHWFMHWIETGNPREEWVAQGGFATFSSYGFDRDSDIAQRHYEDLFSKLDPYIILDDDKLFVHGGYNWKKPLKETPFEMLLWDRKMYRVACQWSAMKEAAKNKFGDWRRIFIGHTSTQYAPNDKCIGTLNPRFISNLVALDTGAGWRGKLTIMDIDTLEYWQSDDTGILYPNDHR